MPRLERIKSGSKDRIKSNKINVPGIESYTGGVVQRDEALGESRDGVELPPPLLHRLHHGAPNAPPRNVTDRDRTFTNRIWQDIFKSMKTTL
jgi:hypothetical protein